MSGKSDTTLDHDKAVNQAKYIDPEAWEGNKDEMRDRRVRSIAEALKEQGWEP